MLLAVAVRPAVSQQGQLDGSPTLFTVMAAINAAGYDADLQSPSNHPLRDAVRAELAKRNIPCLAEIKEFYQAHKRRTDTGELSQYISFAMSVGGPPDFTFKARSIEIPPDAGALNGFS